MPDIFHQLVTEMRTAEHAASALFRHHDHQAVAIPAPPEGAPLMSNVLAELHASLTEGVGNIKGWVASLEAKLPELAARAEQYNSSLIMQSLEGVILPPALEQDIANLIQHYAAANPAPPQAPTAAPATTPATTGPQPVRAV